MESYAWGSDDMESGIGERLRLLQCSQPVDIPFRMWTGYGIAGLVGHGLMSSVLAADI